MFVLILERVVILLAPNNSSTFSKIVIASSISSLYEISLKLDGSTSMPAKPKAPAMISSPRPSNIFKSAIAVKIVLAVSPKLLISKPLFNSKIYIGSSMILEIFKIISSNESPNTSINACKISFTAFKSSTTSSLVKSASNKNAMFSGRTVLPKLNATKPNSSTRVVVKILEAK